MSIFKGISIKSVLVETILLIAAALLITGLGAGLVVAGLVAPDNAWICVCVAWGFAGLTIGRRAAVRGENWLIRSIICLLMAIALMWLTGLTTPGVRAEDAGHYLWYIGSGFIGALAAVVVPQKRGNRKKGKKKGSRVRS